MRARRRPARWARRRPTCHCTLAESAPNALRSKRRRLPLSRPQAFARRPDVTVFATARSEAKMAGLADAGCTLLPLDVTDDASVAAAAARVDAATGGRGVDVLVRVEGWE